MIMPQICHAHCPAEGGGRYARALVSIAGGTAAVAFVAFVLTHIWLILGCAAALAVGTTGTLIAMRGALSIPARNSVGASPAIARRLAWRGVPAQVIPVALPPPSVRVLSVEKVPDPAHVIPGYVLPAGERMRP